MPPGLGDSGAGSVCCARVWVRLVENTVLPCACDPIRLHSWMAILPLIRNPLLGVRVRAADVYPCDLSEGEAALQPSAAAGEVFLQLRPHRGRRFTTSKPVEDGPAGDPAVQIGGFDTGDDALLSQDGLGGSQPGGEPPGSLAVGDPPAEPLGVLCGRLGRRNRSWRRRRWWSGWDGWCEAPRRRHPDNFWHRLLAGCQEQCCSRRRWRLDGLHYGGRCGHRSWLGLTVHGGCGCRRPAGLGRPWCWVRPRAECADPAAE